MGVVSLDDILLTTLKIIPTVGGDVMHAIKNTDIGFHGFGEVYCSWVEPGAIKAWKCHQKMTLNIVVPIGEVSFVFCLPEKKTIFRKESIGLDRYARLTIPPGIWFGFHGLAFGHSLLMNLADMAHDPDEVLRKTTSEVNYNWSSK